MPTAAHELPFQGGWLIYLGYELAAEIEPTLRLAANPEPLGALAIRTPAAWVRERSGGRAWLVCEQGSEALLDRFAAHAGATPTALQPVAAEAALAAYRTAQEALTNARKHAPGQPGRLCLEFSAREIAVQVVNGLLPALGEDGPLAEGGTGYGLTGLRERAARSGGTLTAGPADGEWDVCLRIPA